MAALIQKSGLKTRHSILQKRLLTEVDNHSVDYTALPERQGTFARRSIVPDIAVVAWNRIQINQTGEPEDGFTEAPDWTIEILSPDQRTTRVIDNLLHYLEHGCKLGWLIDPDDYSVLIFPPQREPDVYRADRPLPVLAGVNLAVTAAQVFAWLKVGNR